MVTKDTHRLRYLSTLRHNLEAAYDTAVLARVIYGVDNEPKEYTQAVQAMETALATVRGLVAIELELVYGEANRAKAQAAREASDQKQQTAQLADSQPKPFTVRPPKKFNPLKRKTK